MRISPTLEATSFENSEAKMAFYLANYKVKARSVDIPQPQKKNGSICESLCPWLVLAVFTTPMAIVIGGWCWPSGKEIILMIL